MSVVIKTIKGTRQKISPGSYADYVPFGADGKYIDMMSGLDLEKELRLGGNHITKITNNGTRTIITEVYGDSQNATDCYKVITTIGENNGNTEIISVLTWVDNQGTEETKATKIITIASTGAGTNISEVLT